MKQTCAPGTRLPHKVASGFPVDTTFSPQAIEALATYVRNTPAHAGIRRYLSLHSLGGAVGQHADGPFSFRNRDVLLQYQAWWADPHDAGTAPVARSSATTTAQPPSIGWWPSRGNAIRTTSLASSWGFQPNSSLGRTCIDQRHESGSGPGPARASTRGPSLRGRQKSSGAGGKKSTESVWSTT